MTYDIGDVVHLTAQFVDAGGVPADPTTVTLTVKHPGATDTITALAHDGPGAYHYDLPITESGVWQYRWTGTGAVATAEEGQFLVREQFAAVTPPASGLEALLATLEAQLVKLVMGQSVVSIETPQLGRVVYNQASIAELQRVIDNLRVLVNPAAAVALRRRPISVEACP